MKRAKPDRGLFIEAMVRNGGNQRQAALEAGCKSERAADVYAQRMCKVVQVQQEIERRRAAAVAKAEEKTDLTIEGTLRELNSLVHSDLRKCFNPETGALLPPHLWPDDVARSMASVKVVELAGGMKIDGKDGAVEHIPMYTKEVKLWDKNAAIDKAMKHLGLFEKDNDQTRPLIVPDIYLVPVRAQTAVKG